MLIKKGLMLAAGATLLASSVAFADGHGGNPAVKARKAHMQLYAFNLGTLGGMAKGEIEYSADQAQAAADNLASLTALSQAAYWAPGTSNAELGDHTRSLPALWDSANWPDIMAKSKAMGDAAMAMKASAGSLDGIRAAIGDVGKACGACHKTYRAPKS